MNTSLILRSFLLSQTICLFAGCAPPPGGAQPPSLAGERESQTTAVATTAALPQRNAAEPQAESPAPPRAAPRRSQEERNLLEHTLLASSNPHERRGAVDKLSALPEANDALLRTLMSDPDPLVRRWSALALERRPASRAVAGGIRQALIAESDPAVRSVLSRSLASVETELGF